jgi:hypothetical protein
VGLRFAVCAGTGALGGLVVAIVGPVVAHSLSGWDIAALLFVSDVAPPVALDAADTAKQARRENPRRAAADARLLSASVASLIAAGLVLVRAGHNGLSKALLSASASPPSSSPGASFTPSTACARPSSTTKAHLGASTSTREGRRVTSISRTSL